MHPISVQDAHREVLHALWQSRDDDGNQVPLRTSEISAQIERVRQNRGLPRFSTATIPVTLREMREKKLLKIFRFQENGRPVEQVSNEDIEAALKTRDRQTGYGAAVAIEDVEGAVDSRWETGDKAFLARYAAPLFGEAFNLQQVFVPPLAYWSVADSLPRTKGDGPDRGEPHRTPPRQIRHVVDVLKALDRWIDDPADTVRILDGTPGAGKSSVARTFAARQISAGRRVVYVPLHELDPALSAERALDEFARDHAYPTGILDPAAEHGDLLLCCDGLDELQQTDDQGRSPAYTFANKIQAAVGKCRAAGRTVHVLYCGRPIAAQHLADLFPCEKEHHHLLPFYIPEEDRPTEYSEDAKPGEIRYVFDQGVGEADLAHDRRDNWWSKFAKGEMPAALKDESLREFTTQPLLLTLLALAYRDRDVAPAVPHSPKNPVPSNPFRGGGLPARMADVYAWLVRKVYDREWGSPATHITTKPLTFGVYRNLLGLLGLTAWRTGGGRTATVPAVEALAEPLRLKPVLNDYRKSFREGTVGLFLSSFYKHAERTQGVETFQFTLKPFAEHLAAVGLARLVAFLTDKHRGADEAEEDWSVGKLAGIWLEVTGQGVVTNELHQNLREEVGRRQEQEGVDVGAWRQATLALFNHVLREGFPLPLHPGSTTRAVAESAGRAEHALLCALGACAEATMRDIPADDPPPNFPVLDWRATEDEQDLALRTAWTAWSARHPDVFVEVDWPSQTAAADLLRRIRLQQQGSRKRRDLFPMAHHNLNGQRLHGCDLSSASLTMASLVGANLVGADLGGADLRRADLRRAFLDGANLGGAFLDGAFLDGANFTVANLSNATYGDLKLDTPEGRAFLKSKGAFVG